MSVEITVIRSNSQIMVRTLLGDPSITMMRNIAKALLEDPAVTKLFKGRGAERLGNGMTVPGGYAFNVLYDPQEETQP